MSIQQKIDLARRELLEMGLKSNPLLNYVSNAKTLDIFDELSEQVFDMLVNDTKAMRFLPIPGAYVEEGQEENSNPLPPLQEYLEMENGDGRHEDTFLQTKLSPEKLDKVLLTIENEAHTLLQEQGIEVLYLAIGMLKWYEDKNSSKARYAPLILIPVELKRSSAKDTFSISYTQADLGPNLALAAKLKGEFNVELPLFGDELDEELDVSAYLETVGKYVSKLERWEVKKNNIGLGLFSFGKFQMFTDLDPKNWPDDKPPAEHPLLKNLFASGFSNDAQYSEGLSEHKGLREPETLHLVKDSDSSQTEAVLLVMQGSNLVIQGPPGTGKSQTITNIIAEALARGKKVLFVAQKMAALAVVKQRLDDCHLGDSVLELHSHKSTQKAVLASIKETFDQGKPSIPDRQNEYARLKQVRKQLDDYVAAIKAPILESGFNYIQALGLHLSLQKQEGYKQIHELSFSLIEKWNAETLTRAERALQAVADHIDNFGVPVENPFYLTTRAVLSPIEQGQILKLAQACGDNLEKITKESDCLANEMALPLAKNINEVEVLYRAATRAMSAPKLTGVSLTTDDWQLRRDSVRQLVEAGLGMKTLFEAYKERFIEQAFESVVLGIRQGLVGRVDKWWRIFSGKYRRAKSDLQGYCKEPLNGKATEWLVWVDDLLAYQNYQKTFNESQALGESLFGAQWQGKGSDWEVLTTISEWLFSLYDDIGKGEVPQSITQFLAGNASLVDWQDRLDTLNELVQHFNPEMSKLVGLIQIEQSTDLYNFQHFNADDLQVIVDNWCDVEPLYHAARFNQLKEDLVKIGLAPIAEVAKSWDKPTASLTLSLKVCYYSGLVNSAYSKHASIHRFDRISHERLINEFIETDGALFDYAQESLVRQLYDTLPNFNAPGEMDLLRREISKKRRHISIRRLVGETATVLQQTKPVFMMSPMSVATYLPQGAIEFDLVIFDEASQIEAPDALGAIARGKQVVVVGDSKQMPPTNFFGRAVELSDEEAEESVTADIESILGMMLVRGASEAMLRWHYRSRHHSLITVSNNQFYNNKLMVFPSPGIHPDATGLKLNHLPNTTYDRGGSRTNAGEAEYIANAVIDHARHRSHLSLGVVAFSMAQKEAILLCVERVRRECPDTEDFFKHHEGGDEFFIKNLENVQGDERDVIFISIGYGRSVAGNLSSSFGPVNSSGGERRLNVLISRARMVMEVFCNFVAEDMRTKAESPFGVKALKVFLKYAETGELVLPAETGKEADSPFEEEVHDAIKSLGYEVEPQVGSSGFFIDLAVRDPAKPGRYILAVECDGASYHSSASARDRDRLRQGVLEGLGWRFHRIWSTDWFRNAAGEIERLKESIEQSIAYYNNLSANGSSLESRTPSQKAKVSIQREEKTAASQIVIPSYMQMAHGSLALPSVDDFSEIDSESLKVAIEKIVALESPIHFNVLTSRLINAAGFKKAGNKIRSNVKSHAKSLASKGRVKLSGDFLLTASGSPVKMRDWSNLDSSSKKIEYVSDHELEISIHHIVSDAFSIGMDDCISAALSLLGFKRVTAIAKERMEALISTMLFSGALATSNNRLQLKV